MKDRFEMELLNKSLHTQMLQITMSVFAYSSLKIIGLYQKMKLNLLYIKIILNLQKALLRSFEKNIQLDKKIIIFYLMKMAFSGLF